MIMKKLVMINLAEFCKKIKSAYLEKKNTVDDDLNELFGFDVFQKHFNWLRGKSIASTGNKSDLRGG